MKVLLSIKPQFAEKIFSGEKGYEFRRSIFKNPNVKKVIVYASSPVQKVVGEFDIEKIVFEDIQTLWQETQNKAGISEDYFRQYFIGKEKGFAIKIKNTRIYKRAKCLKKEYKVSPPQSFSYLN